MSMMVENFKETAQRVLEMFFHSRHARRRRYQPLCLPSMVQVLETRSLLSGQPIVVTTLADSGAGSLRNAITMANSDTGNSDTITFSSSLFSNNMPATITLTSGVLQITNSMTITGFVSSSSPGLNLLTVSGNNNSEIFWISSYSANVSISHLTLSKGNTQQGGAITNLGVLTLSNNTISGNFATGLSGEGDGGGIYNIGTLTSMNDTITGNSATGQNAFGGGIFNSGTLTMTNDTVSSNSTNASSGTNGKGGGIYNRGTLTSTGNTIFGNSSSFGGGGIYNLMTLTSTNDTIFSNSAATASPSFSPSGGGVFNDTGTLTTVNDTIASNSASGPFGGTQGGGVCNSGTWNSLNTIVAGNTTGGDVFNNGNPINASYTLIGDANSAGGITGGVNGNIVGAATTAIFQTNGGVPVLANNGGPTQTIALVSGSPATNAGGGTRHFNVHIHEQQHEHDDIHRR